MRNIEIYCDESRQDLIANKKVLSEYNKYVVLGGIWVDSSYRNTIKDKIKGLKEKHNINGEFKWKSVSSNKKNFYIDIINMFFKEDPHKIAFRGIVIDASLLDIEKYFSNSQELGFYKFYYQLLKTWINKEDRYNILLDYRKDKSKNRVYELKDAINSYLKIRSVTNIQFVNSKESLIMQLEDVIMGAVGYKYNWKSNGKSLAKNALVNEIEKFVTINKKEWNEPKFNIFEIGLKGGI